MKPKNMLPNQAIISYWKRFDLPKDVTVLVACSGGADSVALLRAFLDVKECLGLRIAAANIDHAIRPDPEMDKERELLSELSRSFNCPIVQIPLGKNAVFEAMKDRKDGMESAARRLRHAALNDYAASIGASRIAFAHTSDDQEETVLMRFLQGSGPVGLKGIPPMNGKIIRPFLEVSKKTLIEYLHCLKIPHSHDSTNDSTDMLRNRIRLEILPTLRKAFPDVGNALARTAERNISISYFLIREASQIPWTSDESGMRVEANLFFSAHEALRVESFYAAFDMIKKDTRLPWHLVTLAVSKQPRNNREIFVFSGIRCEYRFGSLILSNHQGEKEFFVNVDAPGDVAYGKKNKISVYWSGAGLQGIPESLIRFPFVIRSVRVGDRISIRGGRKLVHDLLSEQGLDPVRKSMVPIIEFDGTIISVLAGFVGGKTRYAELGIDPALPEFAEGRHLNFTLKGTV